MQLVCTGTGVSGTRMKQMYRSIPLLLFTCTKQMQISTVHQSLVHYQPSLFVCYTHPRSVNWTVLKDDSSRFPTTSRFFQRLQKYQKLFQQLPVVHPFQITVKTEVKTDTRALMVIDTVIDTVQATNIWSRDWIGVNSKWVALSATNKLVSIATA